MKRAACRDWPAILNPEAGCYPPAAPLRDTERTLFAKLANSLSPQTALSRALRSLGPMGEISWRDFTPPECRLKMLEMARELCPTLVFLHLQRGGTFCEPGFVEELRAHCDPTCVIVNYDGDQFYPVDHIQRRWQISLGRVVDTTLLVNTGEQMALAQLEVRHPGFLSCGVDETFWHPRVATELVSPIVFLGGWKGSGVPGYQRRNDGLDDGGHGWSQSVSKEVRDRLQHGDHCIRNEVTHDLERCPQGREDGGCDNPYSRFDRRQSGGHDCADCR